LTSKAPAKHEISLFGLALGLFIDMMATPTVDGIAALRYCAIGFELGNWSDC
jgi:hypothetical protein